MRLVIVQSPYAADIEANVAYARACLADSLQRGEAPIASHLLYTQPGVLRDEIPEERRRGIEAGLAWGRVAELTAVYADRGFTPGMEQGIERAKREGRPVRIPRIRQPWMCWDGYDLDRDDTDHCTLPSGHDGWHSDGVGGYWEEGA